ncbi:oxygen-independent coproporphyrinogen-3 oxidase [Alteromonadaceae bacterium Bs31]|nr:oxygen-independent coproporphyrinogen-3 oxidase [Alteromonadaceae bacterium Bs31]
MLNLLSLPPLALYVHIPWCVRKCPYCDFNSHQRDGEMPLKAYTQALIEDLRFDSHLAQGRNISSVFFGGGTPSLMPGEYIAEVLEAVDKTIGLKKGCEITLEANPGTAEFQNFSIYRKAGVNRLSMGAQSFDASQLKKLGRIHSPSEITRAFTLAREAGIENINLDLMFGLEKQNSAQATDDLAQAIALKPEHISWYQLTIEQNTAFYSRPPPLPDDDILWDIQQAGQALLAREGYQHYEISAYARAGKTSRHNLNYWQFGDYLAIGAGAHGKITQLQQQQVLRYRKTRLPEHYLAAAARGYTASSETVDSKALPFEFMMNALRLCEGAELSLFNERTGLPLSTIEAKLAQLRDSGLLDNSAHAIRPSALGHRYLNNLLEHFL